MTSESTWLCGCCRGFGQTALIPSESLEDYDQRHWADGAVIRIVLENGDADHVREKREKDSLDDGGLLMMSDDG